METTTSFDLSAEIRRWRDGLAQSPAFQGENLKELESHLCDAVANLQSRGLSGEEAFIIATRRIGKDGALEKEFAKLNRKTIWLDRSLWMLIGIQIWGLATSLTGPLSRNALLWGLANRKYNFLESGLTLPVTLFGVVNVLALGASLFLSWWLVIGKGEKFGAWLMPLLLKRSTLIGTCVGLILCSLAIYSFNFGLRFFTAKLIAVPKYSSQVYFTYSQLIEWPLRLVTMIILTVAIARKRFRLKQTA